MLAVVAMASCSKSELTTRPEVAGDVEIMAGSKVINTRKPFEGTLDDTAEKTLEAYVMATKLDVANSNAYVSYADANVAAKGYMTFKSDAAQTAGKYPVAAVGFQNYNSDAVPALVDDPQFYPANDNPLYMVGLIPSTITEWAMDADSKNADHTIDGKTDIMTDAATTMNDGSSVIRKSTASTTVYPAFTFEHQLTLVNVKVVTPSDKEQAAWGKITKIELIGVNGVTDGVNNKCTVKLEDATATFSGAGATVVIPFYAYDATDKYTDLLVSTDTEKTSDADHCYGAVEIPTTTAAQVAYAMIAPFEVTSAGSAPVNLTLKVYTEKNTDGVEAEVKHLYNTAYTPTSTDYFSGNTKGKKFDITLEFKGKPIVASATVDDWDVVYTATVPVE